MIKVKYYLDHESQLQFLLRRIELKNGNYICKGEANDEESKIDVYFDVKDSAAILELMDWGDFNWCPPASVMAAKVREFQEKYGAELIEIRHDTLVFKCRNKLDDSTVQALLEELENFPSNAMDLADREVIKERLKTEGVFELWWD